MENTSIYIFNDECGNAAQYGIGTYLSELVKCADNEHINITIITLYARDIFSITNRDNIRYINIPQLHCTYDSTTINERYYRNVFYIILGYLENSKNIIFHFNYTHHLPLALKLKRQFSTAKIILTIHCLKSSILTLESTLLQKERNYELSVNNEITKIFERERSFMNVANRIICLCEETKEIILKKYQIQLSKIKVMRNFIQDRRKGKDNPTQLRERYGFDIADKIILYIGRIEKSKGILDFVETINLLRKSEAKVRLIIAGDGSYNRMLSEYKFLWSHITFVGLVDKVIIDDLCQIANIGIIPSYSEQCSYVAIEMMMHSLPIIGLYSTGLKDMFKEEENKYFVTQISEYSYSSIEMHNKILSLLENKAERDYWGKICRQKFELYYSSINRNILDELYNIEIIN